MTLAWRAKATLVAVAALAAIVTVKFVLQMAITLMSQAGNVVRSAPKPLPRLA
ncbi:hypothetical protein ACQEVZ_49435 [Dactylosporangium sp. CA-152071]|uniref:hypothetical protein n=1 Tax=Dactylosporangium sp. CA-152071 TaxID=3239933 RepID=UPI003D8D1420